MRGRIRGGLVAQRLSRDHKPENKGERERIQAAGGIVFPLPRSGTLGDGDGREGPDVPRVWAASGEGPGLAMSRSIGDKV
ncbi:unnamed protein product, partial [Scytosiphon promiscuus]